MTQNLFYIKLQMSQKMLFSMLSASVFVLDHPHTNKNFVAHQSPITSVLFVEGEGLSRREL